MRLVDVDTIEYKMLYKEDFLRGSVVEAQAVWKADIDKMPTVDDVDIAIAYCRKRNLVMVPAELWEDLARAYSQSRGGV